MRETAITSFFLTNKHLNIQLRKVISYDANEYSSYRRTKGQTQDPGQPKCIESEDRIKTTFTINKFYFKVLFQIDEEKDS